MAFQPYQSVAGQVHRDIAAQQAETNRNSSRPTAFANENRAVTRLIEDSDNFKTLLDNDTKVQNAKFMFQGNKVLKYPIDLGMNPEYRNILEIQIWANDPTALATRRDAIFAQADSSMEAQIEINKANNVDPENRQDVSSVAGNFIESGVSQAKDAINTAGSFIETAAISSKVESDMVQVDEPVDPNNPNGPTQKVMRPIKIGSGDYSYVEESTGVAGLTKPIGSMYLYCPAGFEAGYGMEYNTDTDMGGNLELLRLPKAMAKNPTLAKEIGRSLMFNNIKDMEFAGVKGEEAIKAYEASNRIVKNPMLLHTFDKVSRREFSFTFDMYPKSREELLSCHNIIHTLKFHAHPRRSESGRFLDYPSEFKLRFLNWDASENQYMPQILRCCIKSIKVKHGEDVVFSTFTKDDYGQAPTKYNLTLEFSELEILTQDRFDMYGNSILVP